MFEDERIFVCDQSEIRRTIKKRAGKMPAVRKAAEFSLADGG
jgi:hypothetical protein